MAMWLCGYVAMWISSKICDFFECQICKDNISQDVPIYFLIFLRYFCIIKPINTGLQGLENQEIMKNQEFYI